MIAVLNEWQTLISGMLALGAAILAASLLWWQIRQTEKHERSRLRRRLNAARATLPLTLSTLYEYAGESVAALVIARNSIGFHHSGVLPNGFSPPNMPGASAISLREVIEATDDSYVISAISTILSEIQTMQARMVSLDDKRDMANMLSVDTMIDHHLVYASTLHALIGSLFKFARRKTDTGPRVIEWDEVTNVFNRIPLTGSALQGFQSALAQRKAHAQFAWTAEAEV